MRPSSRGTSRRPAPRRRAWPRTPRWSRWLCTLLVSVRIAQSDSRRASRSAAKSSSSTRTSKASCRAMTMPFKVKDGAAHGQAARRSGHGDAGRRRSGRPPVVARRRPGTRGSTPPAPPPTADIRDPGDTVTDASLVDQDGKPTPLSSFNGHRVALTFIYTRCPLPDFCPLMDRNFAAVQKTHREHAGARRRAAADGQLDPAFDTPAVLKPHAPSAARIRRSGLPHRRARGGQQVRHAVRHLRRARSDRTPSTSRTTCAPRSSIPTAAS